jgi:hypothetical protein
VADDLSDNDLSGSPQSDTDMISAQHFRTGGREMAGPGCDDAVAIARAAGFRMLVMRRIRHAAIVLYRSAGQKERPEEYPEKSLPDINS